MKRLKTNNVSKDNFIIFFSKIFFINLIVLIFIIFFFELFARFAWTIKSCIFQIECNYKRILNLKIRDKNFIDKNIGLTKYHNFLGYVPQSGFDSIINLDGWNNKKVSILKNGFRSNDNQNYKSNKFLVVGDSFTFGDQVANNETWPSCLERLKNVGIDNGGVFGYGAAQAVRRALIESQKNNYEHLILSVLQNSNFGRDKLIYRSGFPRPAVIEEDGLIKWEKVPKYGEPGSKFSYKTKLNFKNNLLTYGSEYSQIVGTIMYRFFPKYDYSGKNLTKRHPKAATFKSIVYFTLKKFSEIPIRNKYLLFQYGAKDFEKQDKELISNVTYIKKIARDLDIITIDTYPYLKKELKQIDKRKIWFVEGHHTSFGNDLVCDLISDNIK